nr:immunoglobulin heavy chain junction region [Mus musculus]MBK4195241.1 immunoglobulin heavy chain junction region [Mus musculus]
CARDDYYGSSWFAYW